MLCVVVVEEEPLVADYVSREANEARELAMLPVSISVSGGHSTREAAEATWSLAFLRKPFGQDRLISGSIRICGAPGHETV